MRDPISEFLHSPRTCLLLVSPNIQKLADKIDELLVLYDYPCLSIGRALSEALLFTLPKHRPHTANQWIRRQVSEMTPGPILITRMTLLFHPSLELDPLRLMRDVSRRTRMIVAWPGNCADNVLSYAVPDHAHYRTWREPQIPIAYLTQDE